jgi:Ankyrin repeats (3 copies)/Ankyrin repeat
MNPMGQKFIPALQIWAILFLAPAAFAAELSEPATVRVGMLPVYAGPSVTGGIIKFLKKEEGVEVQSELFNAEGKWCAIGEPSKKTHLGYVNCEGLFFPGPQKPTSARGEETRSQASLKPEPIRPLARPPSAESREEKQPAPAFGEFLQALWQEDLARVENMLKAGIDPNAQTTMGNRPLLIAAKKKNPRLLEILIAQGANVDAADRNGLTPLMAAASMGLDQNVRVLISAGAKVNARDEKGSTALIWAAISGQPQVVEILMAHGADGKVKNKDGHTALSLSKRINASRKRSLAEAEEANRNEELAELRKGLARHEAVLGLLEKAEER